MTSTVHEIGHYLDQWGFGTGPVYGPGRSYYSGTQGMQAWWDAVARSRAYNALATASENPGYELARKELLARSYEQFIAERSGNPVLQAKIAERRRINPHLYWADADFRPISEAFERMLKTLGLM